MEEGLKNRWVTALKSGTYQQGMDVLRTPDDKYCCLGVLCDIIDPDGWSKDEDVEWMHQNGAEPNGHGDTTLSEWTQNETGISGEQVLMLTRLNDSLTDFDVIALVIETTL